MKLKFTTLFLLSFLVISCYGELPVDMSGVQSIEDEKGDEGEPDEGGEEEEEEIPTPPDVTSLEAEAKVGAVLLSWDNPEDSTTYSKIEVTYIKNEKDVLETLGVGIDSLVVDSLINAEEFIFKFQTIYETEAGTAKGNVVETDPIRPIRRDSVTTYELQDFAVEITADMIDTYTQQTSEGPKENLIDGDPATYWHSAWSGTTAPLPHWIQINLMEPQKMGAITYWLRDHPNPAGRPSQFGLAISSNGTDWEQVWASEEDLPTDEAEAGVAFELPFDKNYEAKYFRILILQTIEDKTFTHLGEISFHTAEKVVTDKEAEAEEVYYNY